MPYQLGIPFARRSSTSFKAAVAVAPTRGKVTARYLELLKAAGTHGLTDAEASEQLGRPVSTVCSVRNGASACGLVRKAGEREGRWGVANQIWQHTDIRANA